MVTQKQDFHAVQCSSQIIVQLEGGFNVLAMEKKIDNYNTKLYAM